MRLQDKKPVLKPKINPFEWYTSKSKDSLNILKLNKTFWKSFEAVLYTDTSLLKTSRLKNGYFRNFEEWTLCDIKKIPFFDSFSCHVKKSYWENRKISTLKLPIRWYLLITRKITILYPSGTPSRIFDYKHIKNN